MKPNEKNTLDNLNHDYAFLRINDVCAKTAIKMIGMGYSYDKY